MAQPVHGVNMPELDHLPHEMFALFVARGNHPLSAAVAAGYPRDPELARALLKQPRIAARIKELQPTFHQMYRTRVSPQTILKQRREEDARSGKSEA